MSDSRAKALSHKRPGALATVASHRAIWSSIYSSTYNLNGGSLATSNIQINDTCVDSGVSHLNFGARGTLQAMANFTADHTNLSKQTALDGLVE